jgi:UDP-N-acetylmuramate-alanine ligase
MTRDEAMHWWFARVNFEVRAAAAWDLKLEAMRLLLERLGNPQHGLPIVHVAGSKGKGSTSAMLAAVLRQCGASTASAFSGAPVIDAQGRVAGVTMLWFEPRMRGEKFLESGGEDASSIYKIVEGQ